VPDVSGRRHVVCDPSIQTLAGAAQPLPHGRQGDCLSDTVGFISNLPTQLVCGPVFARPWRKYWRGGTTSFSTSATSRMKDAEAQQRDVDTVLRQLGIDPEAGGRTFWKSGNKIDRFDF